MDIERTFSFSDKVISMLWSGSPPNAVISIKFDSCATFLLIDNLETIIVDEHVGRSTLKFISGDGLLD